MRKIECATCYSTPPCENYSRHSVIVSSLFRPLIREKNGRHKRIAERDEVNAEYVNYRTAALMLTTRVNDLIIDTQRHSDEFTVGSNGINCSYFNNTSYLSAATLFYIPKNLIIFLNEILLYRYVLVS